MHGMKDVDSLHEMLQKFLSVLPIEQRLAGIAPEQRLAGLSPEQQILALSDEVLRGMPDEYLRTLPAGVQEAIRERLARTPSTK